MINCQQKDATVSREDAYKLLKDKFPQILDVHSVHDGQYYAYPQTFGSTAGPFKGRLAGQAFSVFTIEAWVFGKSATLFCNGEIVRLTDEWEGTGSIRL